VETKPRTPVIWLHGLECICCSESFIRSAHPLVSDAVLSMISLDYDDLIMASAGHQAEAILEKIKYKYKYKGNYILAVEGNPPLNQEGMSCIIAGRPFVAMWRGLEVILKGRDPLDAWALTERICGVCTGTHAVRSVRAVEDALGIEIPENANSIRNIMQLTLQAQDHLVHFYHLHALDWVDVVSALSADPGATSQLAQSISERPLSSPGYFRDVQTRLKRLPESGQLGPFMNAYWGHPAYKLPPEANLRAVAHCPEALNFQ
jgi:hypothetical protein